MTSTGTPIGAVYTVKLRGTVYALHAFQKKSKKGRRTSQHDVELVRRRLKQAEEIHARRGALAKGEAGEEEN